MNVLGDVTRELLGMFLADGRLTLATLVLVAVVAVLLLTAHAAPLVAGLVLLGGCLAILVEATLREARHRHK
ncbi:hypothetical protein ACTDI4_18215 [Mesorhizobium sp. PUT5]|uniref:hypothetical protein n=1 Tax=Mesorhizobium sp. PUT5 TaxID=3454629 RepID=UPI003FA40739